VVDISILHPLGPLKVIDIIHTLKVHRNSFNAVSDLNGNGAKLDPSRLLEVSELGDLHSV
jgi:hypothetical protein